MSLRKVDVFLLSISVAFCFFAFIFVHASLKKKSELPALRESSEMVRTLEITDICLFAGT